MSLILHLETSTKNCSVALAKDGQLIHLQEEVSMKYSHAEKLHLFIQESVTKSGHHLQDLDAIAIGKGPGSYTGLRIGTSTAKGLAMALDIPLISFSTLQALAKKAADQHGEQALICPMLDARRMEVYTAVYDHELQEKTKVDAIILDQEFTQAFLEKNKVVFLGDGMPKWREVCDHANAIYQDDLYPSAGEMIQLVYQKFEAQDFEDVAYYEPFYLKDFVATKPKSLI